MLGSCRGRPRLKLALNEMNTAVIRVSSVWVAWQEQKIKKNQMKTGDAMYK